MSKNRTVASVGVDVEAEKRRQFWPVGVWRVGKEIGRFLWKTVDDGHVLYACICLAQKASPMQMFTTVHSSAMKWEDWKTPKCPYMGKWINYAIFI